MSTIDKYNNLTFKNDFNNYIIWIPICLRAILMFGLSLITIVGNSIVIYALRTNRHLRTVGNLFILSLATADLVVGCFVMPIAGIYAIMETWHMGLILCQIWLSVDFTASTASIFNLLTLSLDRYWSITSPLQYLGKRTRTRALLLIGFAWGLSLLWVIPIFGWHSFVNNGTRYIDSFKCEPEYTHSKIFKVSTAIINFYLPLLVLISLNARIYYDIKRRYKNVLLQRHSNIINDSSNNSKSNIPRLTMNIYDNDKQTCSPGINYLENDSLISSKRSSKNNLTLRINYKENNNQPMTSVQLINTPKIALKRIYSYVEKNPCSQDELSSLGHHNRHSCLSLQTTPVLRSVRAASKYRLNVDERCLKHIHNYNSCRIYSNKQAEYSYNSNRDVYNYDQTEPQQFSRTRENRILSDSNRFDLLDQIEIPSKKNLFYSCYCCIRKTSNRTNHSNLEFDNDIQRISSSSLSSSFSRKQQALSFYNYQTNNTISRLKYRSCSYSSPRPSNTLRQSTVLQQQEKAFRQLFAIVFGFTCCFLPYFILYMVVAFCGSCVSERIVTTTIWLGYVNSAINPFLYALSNEHFRRTFHHIFKRDRRRQSYDNKTDKT